MPTGPGKYNAECTQVRERLGALGVVLLVIGGPTGSGFSVQVPQDEMLNLAKALRVIAEQVEKDFKAGLT